MASQKQFICPQSSSIYPVHVDTVELDPPRSRHLSLDLIRYDYEHLRHDNDHVKTIESPQ
ncbi:hypothetical protein KIN20_019285, partial [Parelaphostrongylus tenuis]